MGNPFEILEERLAKIENLLLDITHKAKHTEPSEVKDEILNIKQASALLGLAIPTLYSMVSQRRIPYSKQPNSKKLMFMKADLLQWVKNGRKSTSDELKLEAKERLTRKSK